MKIGPYEAIEEVGRGGMSVVYRARSADGREVALKLLAGDVGDEQALRELRLLGSLSQADGFVPVIDSGSERGRRYMVMPFVAGGTLRERLRRGPLPVAEAAAIVERLAKAMGRAHERGIVHRDLKPENVLLDAEGTPLVSDLGLAKHFRRDLLGGSKSGSLTGHGVIAGTLGYLAPEQLEDSKEARPPADVFALGVILHELLTGKRPFEGEGLLGYAEALSKSKGVRPSRARPEVPRWLDTVVARAVERDEARRFADAGALALALRAGATRRRPFRLALIAAILLLVPLGWGALRARARALELVALAEARVAAHDWDGAIAAATKALELDPRAARAWANRAVARGFKSDFDGELQDATRALELDRRLALAWAARGAPRAQKGDVDGAVADATRAIELDPGLALGWINRGAARSMKGEGDAAIADLTRGIELDPGYSVAWSERGYLRGAKDDWQGQVADMSKAIELDPGCAAAWAHRGAARGQLGDLDAALVDGTRAIELEPGLAFAWVERAAVRRLKGDWAGALADCDRGIALAPDVAHAWEQRGAALEASDVDGAIANLSHAIELDPRRPFALAERGSMRSRKGDDAGAIEDLTRAIALAPGSAKLWANRGAVRTPEHPDEAIADLTKALELEPGLAFAWAQRGAARGKKGDWDGQIADATRAIELDPGLAFAWVTRSIARSWKGDHVGVIADCERYLELAPDGPDAPEVRRALEDARGRAR